jgi:hypothetical protein
LQFGAWGAAVNQEETIAEKLNQAASGLNSISEAMVQDDLQAMQRALDELKGILDQQNRDRQAAQSGSQRQSQGGNGATSATRAQRAQATQAGQNGRRQAQSGNTSQTIAGRTGQQRNQQGQAGSQQAQRGARGQQGQQGQQGRQGQQGQRTGERQTADARAGQRGGRGQRGQGQGQPQGNQPNQPETNRQGQPQRNQQGQRNAERQSQQANAGPNNGQRAQRQAQEGGNLGGTANSGNYDNDNNGARSGWVQQGARPSSPEEHRRFFEGDYRRWVEGLRNAEALLPEDDPNRGRIADIRTRIDTMRRAWLRDQSLPEGASFNEQIELPLAQAALELDREIARKLNAQEFNLSGEGAVPAQYTDRVAEYFKALSEQEKKR